MIAGLGEALNLIRLRDTIVRARPELARQMSDPDGRKFTIDLPRTQTEPAPVVIARIVVQRVFTWMIVGHAGKAGAVTTAWPTGTDSEVLRDAALAVYDACACERALESPWRWNQPAVTPIVQMADALTDVGVEVQRVVSTNRLIEDEDGVGLQEGFRRVGPELGDALRVATQWGSVTLGTRDGLGWVLDTADEGNAWRLDLSQLATGRPSDGLGLATDDTEIVVGALARLAVSNDRPQNPLRHLVDAATSGHQSSHDLAGRWLHAMGFSTVRAPEHKKDSWGGPFHVVTRDVRCSLSALKIAFADATVAGKRLVAFSAGGFTSPAVKWANNAAVPLFGWSAKADRPVARSQAAEALMPHVL